MMRKMRTLQILVVVLLVGSLSACVSYRSYRQAQLADQTGDWDKAVLFYMKASSENPNNVGYKAALLRAKGNAAQAHFDKARKYQVSGLLERALVEFQQAVSLDPSNQSALVELDRVREEIKSRDQGRGPATIAEMKERAAERNQPPTLNPRSNEPIDLEFPKPASIQTIYKALGDAFGINVLFDPNLKDQEIPLVLKQVVAQDALEFLMRAAGHFYKVMDEHTIIVAADTPQNRRNYQDLVIKTFFLSNAEVKDVVTMLRSLIDAKKIATNEQLNAIILRDTADKVKVAERIIRANDKARAEVVVDIELLQVNSSKLLNLGVTWPKFITTSANAGGDDGSVRLSDVQFLDQSNWTISIPSFTYNFAKENTDAQVLAKPQLRISEGERASLTIGDRVPVPVTSFNTGNTVGGNIVPITSFQYQDVGIQISIEPRVHHNKEVSLTIQVEVSSLSGFVDNGSQPIIATRNFESTIRLKDGETNFLAGLLRTDETRSDTGLPGLSELPIIGRLFGNNNNNNQRTDVVLTLTPHIIRSADITPEDLEPIWVGTESNITFRGGSPRVESNVEGPFDRQAGSSAEDIRELIQRRIQRLPRGLRSQGGQVGNGQPVEEPGGIELVPADSPANLFNDPPADQEDQGNGFRVPSDRRSDDEDQPRNRSRNSPRNSPQADNDPPPSPFGGNNASSTSRLGMDPATSVLAAVRPTPATVATVASFSSAASKVSLVNSVGTQEEAQVRLSLSPRGLWARPGDLFEVTLQVDSSVAVSHLPVTLEFDSTVLAVEGVRPGDFFGEATQAHIIADFSRPGELVIGASRLGDVEGVSGSGALAHITFRAVATGTAEIGFSSGRAMGSKLEEISPVRVEPSAIEVRDNPNPAERPDRPKPLHET